jgi:predicted outer membrane repeat protein
VTNDALDANSDPNIIDVDGTTPGNQVSLRAAIVNANLTTSTQKTILTPTGSYNLTLTGTGGDTQGDLDITQFVTIVGAGAGRSIVNAAGLGTTNRDRVFDVASGGALDLSRVTLTGGHTRTAAGKHGGAIQVGNGGTLRLDQSALVDNETESGGNGGGIYFAASGSGTITRSVITTDHADDISGGIYLLGSAPGAGGTVKVGTTIIVNNTDDDGVNPDVFAETNRTFTSLGFNLLGNAATGFVNGVNGDFINPTGNTVDYVVTSAVDEVDSSNNALALSLRETIQAANVAGGTIWLPAWRHRLTRTGTESGTTNDLDIANDVTIVGVGPGLTVLDASGLGSDVATGNDRIFDVSSAGELDLSRVTLTGGAATGGTGGAIFVSDGEMTVTDAAFVGNSAASGGAIRVAGTTSQVTILRSAFVNNTATNAGAAIYHGDQNSTVQIGESVFARNGGSSLLHRQNGTVNLGNNVTDNTQLGFFNAQAGDHFGTPDYVVTSVADTYNHVDNALNVSTREAVDLANESLAADEIWLPAWDFILTRDRVTYGGGSATDTSVGYGDLDIGRDAATDPGGSVTIRGVNGSTSVAWAAGLPNDKVFELLGDYNDDGSVNTDDGVVLGKNVPEADGDDDGNYFNDPDDDDIYDWNFNAVLTLAGVS